MYLALRDFAVLLSLAEVVHSDEYSFSGDWQGYMPDVQLQSPFSKHCTKSRYTAFETVNTPISFSTSPLEQFEAPKLRPLNTTSGEQWAFDGTSASGLAGLLIGFYRDSAYAFLGPGNLRLSLDVVWENGTRFSVVDYLEESTVEECEDATRGMWAKPGHRYSFEISRDLETAKIEFDTPVVKGSFLINSIAPARYPDGSTFPSENASTWNAPFLHWNEPIPAGHSTVDMMVDGTPFKWTGMGGHERWWAPYSWLQIMKGWQALRAVVGPYSLSYWAPTSRIDDGVLYPSAFLTADGKKIFATRNMLVSVTEDYLVYKPTYDGVVSGSLENQATGYEFHLVSPSADKYWKFIFEHKNMEFEFALGGGSGGTAFVGLASGGEMKELPYEGVFFNEHVDISDLAIPSVYVYAASWFYRIKALFIF